MTRIPGPFQSDEDRSQDSLSAPAPIERRAVHPHRDRRSDGPVEPPSAARRALHSVAAGVIFGASAAGAAALLSLPTMSGARASPAEVAALPMRVPVASIDTATPRSPEPAVSMGEPIFVQDPIGEDDIERHIRWVAPQVWEIDRAFVERAIEGPSLTRAMRFVACEAPDGSIRGVKVFGVRRASLLGRLGVENGDLIIDVNGAPITSSEQGLELFTSLRWNDAFFVRLHRPRHGEERVHVYRVTP